MKTEDKVKIIGMKLYIELLLLDKNIINSIKFKYNKENEDKINALQIYFKKFYYTFKDFNIYITKYKDENKIMMNSCQKNLNPCQKSDKKLKKYKIVIFFNYIDSHKKKMYIPINLFEFDCSNKEILSLEKFSNKIKNILLKDTFLKKIIYDVSLS